MVPALSPAVRRARDRLVERLGPELSARPFRPGEYLDERTRTHGALLDQIVLAMLEAAQEGTGRQRVMTDVALYLQHLGDDVSLAWALVRARLEDSIRWIGVASDASRPDRVRKQARRELGARGLT